MNSKKFLTILGTAGVIVHSAGLPAKAAAPQADLEQYILQDPTSAAAFDAFDSLAARFKDKGDKGRPDSFGPPGKPDIGPPGHYAG